MKLKPLLQKLTKLLLSGKKPQKNWGRAGMKEEKYSLSLKYQILLGLFFALCNLALNFLNQVKPDFSIPLYMDTLFTVSASFFGLISGLICAVIYHLACTLVNHYELATLSWTICSVSVVVIIRLYILKRPEIHISDIILLIFLNALVISLEGAFIFTVLNLIAEYKEDSQIRFMYGLLSANNVPVFISALLPRVPVNILDKGICVSLGYLAYIGINKILKALKKA